MTRHDESNLWPQVMELLAEHGFDGLAPEIELLINQAMLAERSQVLAYSLTSALTTDVAVHGFKPKTVQSRLGQLQLQVPQTCDVPFYPSALERGETPTSPSPRNPSPAPVTQRNLDRPKKETAIYRRSVALSSTFAGRKAAQRQLTSSPR